MFSFFRRTFRQWSTGKSPKAADARRPSLRPQWDCLEDRLVLSLAGPEIFVNTNRVGAQQQAATATASNGNSVVVWTEVKGRSDRDVKAQRFDAAGLKLGGEIVVASGRNPQHSPSVAVDAVGNFVVVWTHDWSPTDKDIHAARFSASGARIGGEFIVADTSRNEYDPSVAMAGNGDFVVSYTHQFSTNDLDVKARLYRASGALVRSFDVSASSRIEERSSVAAAADGRFAIAYQSVGNVYVSRYRADGVRLAAHAVAATSRQEQAPAIALDNAGNSLVVWQELVGSNWNVVGRSISSTGVLGSVFNVAATGVQETLPAVAVHSATGKFAVAYQTQNGSTMGVNVAELSASRSLVRTSTVGTGLVEPSIGVGGSTARFLVAAHSTGGRSLDGDGGIFGRFGTL